jgi:hypothetical protein
MARKIRRKYSRLARTEGKRLMRQTWILLVVTIITLYSIFKWGVPAIINMAVFLGDLKASGEPIGQEDTLPPSTPILSNLPIATTSASLTVNGYTETDAGVKLYRSGAELAETLADESGNFEFLNVLLLKDQNTFYAVATDLAGNESNQSNRVSVIYDTDAPELTIDSPSDGADFYGETRRTITVNGSCDPNSEVKVNQYSVVVSSTGLYSTTVRLEEGNNEIKVVAIDNAGNQTEQTVKVNYAP